MSNCECVYCALNNPTASGSCDHCHLCDKCDNIVCDKCAERCNVCGNTFCKDCLNYCDKCGAYCCDVDAARTRKPL